MTSTKNKYGLSVKMKAKPGNGDNLASILLQASKLVASAKGLHLYLVGIDASDRDTIVITEVWDSKEDHDNSLKMEEGKELIPKAMAIMEGKPEGRAFEVLGGI